jgi:hypothetical protein
MIESSRNSDIVYIQEDEISLKSLILKIREWWRYLLSKFYIIVIGATLLGGIGAGIAYFDEPTYTAELTFVLEGGAQGSQMGGYAGIASQFGYDMGGGGQGVFEGENFLSLMKSRLMIQKALLTSVKVGNKEITLADFYMDISHIREEWAKKGSPLKDVRFTPNSDPASFSTLENTVINVAHKSLIGNKLFVDKKDKKSGIISLRVITENELFSKYFAEILAKEVSSFYVETKTKKSADNVRVLQMQTDSIRNELSGAMASAAISLDANPNPNLSRQVLRVPSQKKQGDAQVNQLILGQLVQNLEIAKMSLRTETPLIQVIDSPVLPLPKASSDMLSSFIKWAIMGGFLLAIFLIVKRVLEKLEL